MGLLKKLFAGADRYAVPTGQNLDCALFEANGNSMEVVGESHYQPALKATWDSNNRTGRSRSVDCFAVLQPQPNNEYDPNAVGVYAVPGGLVGHLSRTDAKRWHKEIADAWDREGRPIAVPARIATRDGNLFGIWLDWPDDFS